MTSETPAHARQTPSLTPGHVSAAIAALGFAIVLGGGLLAIGGMKSKAEATEARAESANAKADANLLKAAIHEEQIKIIREDMRDVKVMLGKIADAVGAKK